MGVFAHNILNDEAKEWTFGNYFILFLCSVNNINPDFKILFQFRILLRHEQLESFLICGRKKLNDKPVSERIQN